MSGLDGVIQATLQNAQAINDLANQLPDSLPTVFIDSITLFETTDIGVDATAVTVAGDVFAGDGGGGTYIRTALIGPGPGLVQSGDGQWWALVDNTVAIPNLFLDSATILAATSVPTYVTNVTVGGLVFVADGGEGVYVHSPTPGPATGKVQSADGQWWRLLSLSSIFLDTQAILHTTTIGSAVADVTVAGTTTVDDGGAGLYVVWGGASGPDTILSANGIQFKLMRPALIKGTATLNGASATSTNVSNVRCTAGSQIYMQATSVGAAGIHPYISSVGSGTFTITHDANTVVCTFFYFVA